MKTPIILSLLAAVTAAPAQPATQSTSVSTEIKDGKGRVTITVEKDGRKETRTIEIDENSPFPALTKEILDKLGAAGLVDPAAAEAGKKVTYLGVMLGEPAGFPFAGGAGFGGAAGSRGGAPAAAGLPPGTGLTVTGVTPGSPAEKAGLQAGDVLAQLNDQILVNPAQFTTLVRTMKEGDVVTLAVVRQGETKQVEATLGSREEEPVPGDPFGGGGLSSEFGRILTIDPAGNVIEAPPGSLGLPPAAPRPPGAPPPPPVPPGTQKPEPSPLSELRPAWEKALREAMEAKEKTAAQWQEQLSKWRAEWAENQQRATEEYRRAMEKMGEELARARETAEKAREEARRAVEEVMKKLEEQKAAPPPEPSKKPEPEEPKNA